MTTATRIVHSTVVGEITARDTCMNGHGLTLGGSSVGSVFQQSINHPPIEAGLYEMLLACHTVAEAISLLQRHPWVGKGYNFVLVDAGGDGAVIECACPWYRCAVLSRVRMPCSAPTPISCQRCERADLRTPTGRAYSDRRYRYLEHELFVEHVPRTAAQMKALLAAHGPEGGLCRPIDEHDPSRTRMSVVALPAERRFLVADGRPCEVAFEQVWPSSPSLSRFHPSTVGWRRSVGRGTEAGRNDRSARPQPIAGIRPEFRGDPGRVYADEHVLNRHRL